MSDEKKLSKEEKKKLYDSRKSEAESKGVKDKKLISAYASGKMELADAVKAQLDLDSAAPKPPQGGSSEQGPGQGSEQGSGESQGQSDAGSEQGEAGKGAPGQNDSESKPSGKNSDPEQSKDKGPKEKIWKLKCNVHCNGEEFKKDQVFSEADKNFSALKEYLE